MVAPNSESTELNVERKRSCRQSTIYIHKAPTSVMARKETKTASATNAAGKGVRRARHKALTERREKLLKKSLFKHRIMFPLVVKGKYVRTPFKVGLGKRPHDAEFPDAGFALPNDRMISPDQIPPNCVLSD